MLRLVLHLALLAGPVNLRAGELPPAPTGWTAADVDHLMGPPLSVEQLGDGWAPGSTVALYLNGASVVDGPCRQALALGPDDVQWVLLVYRDVLGRVLEAHCGWIGNPQPAGYPALVDLTRLLRGRRA
jgi:hypothetical protein